MKEKHPISQEERIAVTAIPDSCSSMWWLDKTVTDMLTDNAEVEIKHMGLLSKLLAWKHSPKKEGGVIVGAPKTVDYTTLDKYLCLDGNRHG